METTAKYDLSEGRVADNLELIPDSIPTKLPAESCSSDWYKRPKYSQNCCIVTIAVVSGLALCAAIIAIILSATLPSKMNSSIEEVLVLKAELAAQMDSTFAPPTSPFAGSSEELKRIRETLETSLNSIGASLENSIQNSLENSLRPIGTLLKRLVAVQENQTCLNPPDPPIGTINNPATSCRDISKDHPSGEYWIKSNASSCPIRVYCNVGRSPCSCKCNTWEGGWMRVANFDMADPSQNCPEGFTQMNSTDPPLRLCGRPGAVGCSSMIFPANGIQYSRVCGRVKSFIFASPDGFDRGRDQTLEGHYVDGVSITHGSPQARTHIWTFAAAWKKTNQALGCPCDTNDYQGTVPSYIGQDFFCESGPTTSLSFRLFPNSPLWDGKGCPSDSMCCTFNHPPYFCQTLAAPTTDDIEVRLCGNQPVRDEDTPIEAIELYVY